MRNTIAVAIGPFLRTHHVSVHEINRSHTARAFSITQQNVFSFFTATSSYNETHS